MSYVAGVSWPRSGHHLLERILREYFGERYYYRNTYADGGHPFDPGLTMPGRVNFSKYHGETALPLNADQRYLIQVRHLIPSTISYFEVLASRGLTEDTKESFKKLLLSRAILYRKFFTDWVFPQHASRSLLLWYEDLTGDPLQHVSRVVGYFDELVPPDRDRIRMITDSVGREFQSKSGNYIVQGMGMAVDRPLDEFRFFDECFFTKVEVEIEDILQMFGRPKLL